MNTYLKFGFLIAVAAVSGVAGTALAQSINSGPGSVNSGRSISPMIVNIGPSGHVLLRGIVESVSGSTVTVKSWGGTWGVRVSSTTEAISTNRTLSNLAAGDFVGVQGRIVPDGSFLIDASVIRAWGKKADHDQDGIADDQDEDDDNDGVSDVSDKKPRDHDNDGVEDAADTDDDDDGIEDRKDKKLHDRDDDGIRDSQDDDDDNDGVDDDEEDEDEEDEDSDEDDDRSGRN